MVNVVKRGNLLEYSTRAFKRGFLLEHSIGGSGGPSRTFESLPEGCRRGDILSTCALRDLENFILAIYGIRSTCVLRTYKFYSCNILVIGT